MDKKSSKRKEEEKNERIDPAEKNDSASSAEKTSSSTFAEKNVPPKKEPSPKAVPAKTDNGEITKILAKEDDELTFIVEQIRSAGTKRIVVSIPEGSDLLVSSVGMRLVAKYADKKESLVVIVTKDAAGQNMARMAGLGVAATMSDVDENSWIDAETEWKSRVAAKSHAAGKEAVPHEGTLINKDFMDNIEAAEGKGSETPAVDEIDEVIEEPIEEPLSEPAAPMDLGRPRSDVKIGVEEDEAERREESEQVSGPDDVADLDDKPEQAPAPVRQVKSVSDGDFTMNIDKGVKSSGTAGNMAAAVSTSVKDSQRKGLVGRDFSGYNLEKTQQTASPDALPTTMDSPGGEPKKKGGALLGKIGGVFAKIPFLAAKPGTALAKRNVKKLMIPVVVVIALAVLGGYWFLPEVVVSLEVESIPVEFEGEITADITVEDTDDENYVIPARSEVETNNGSDSTAATGLASRGEKASGEVTIYNKTDADIEVASGTVLSNGGLGFILQEAVTVPQRPDPIGMGSVNSTVVAQEIGTEYNLSSGTTFAVGAVPLSQLSATNPSAFTGGSSEQYSVVSQNDIDTLAEEIKEKLYKESKTALQEALEGTKWVFVSESIKNELDGDVSSDVPAGSEQDSVNVDVKTKSTALYYDSEQLDELLKAILMEDVGEEELETVELSDNMEKEITVKSASVDDGTVVLSIKVSGFIMPVLDEEKIERDLYGKGWAEGIGYLKQVDYVSGDPEVDFYPEWFPEFARHMPSRDGMITVNIENIVPEDEESENADDNGGTDDDGGTETAEE